jgi:hypothetical protein
VADLGRRTWVIPGGSIPAESTGVEPRWTSHDRLSVLNAGDDTAELEMTVYFEDRDPAGPFELTVEPRRVREVRFNDLVEPTAIELGVPYAAVIRADRPVVVQFTRQDTGQASNAQATTIAYGED